MGTNCVKEPNCWKPPGMLRNSWTYGLGVPLAVDADDDASGLTRARRIRRRESRDRNVMRADVYGLRGRRRATVERRDRELNGVVAVGCKAVRWVAGAGGAVAERPRRRRETDATRVEGLVDELDNVEDRRVEGEEEEVGDRRRRDVEAELDRPALTEQATDQEVVGRPGLGPERHVPTEHVTANFVHAGHRATSVRSDHARNRSGDDFCRD